MDEQKSALKRKLEMVMNYEADNTKEPKTKKKLDDDLKILDIRFSDDAYHSGETINDGIDTVVEAIQLNVPLSISLRANNIGDSHLIKIAKALKDNKSVTYLDVSENKFTREGLCSLIKLLSENKALKTLIFEDIQGVTIDMRTIVPLLANNSTLTVLNIGNVGLDLNDDFENSESDEENYCGIGEIGMNVLSIILLVNTTLQELNLDRNSLGASITYIGQVLQENKSLKKLSLSGNHIDNANLKTIADSLRHNTSLEELDLSGNDISNEGVDTLITMLKTNITIRKINLEGNEKIDSNKLKEIGEILHLCNKLKKNCQAISVILLHKNGIFKNSPIVPPDVLKKILSFTEDLSDEHSKPIIDKHLKIL